MGLSFTHTPKSCVFMFREAEKKKNRSCLFSIFCLFYKGKVHASCIQNLAKTNVFFLQSALYCFFQNWVYFCFFPGKSSDIIYSRDLKAVFSSCGKKQAFSFIQSIITKKCLIYKLFQDKK